MNAEHIQTRLQGALHRGHRRATEEELAEVTAVVLAIVTEVSVELAVVIGELAARVQALEAQATT